MISISCASYRCLSLIIGKHAVFGKLLDGFDVLKKIEAMGSRSGTPSKSVRIAESGELAQ